MSGVKQRSKFDQALNSEMTRRKFMKISGKSLAGLTVSASLLSLFGCTQEQVDSGDVTVWATPTGLLVVNKDLCTGCQRCEINCTLVNDGVVSAHLSRVKLTRNLKSRAGQGMLEDGWIYYPETCRQCEDPWCGNACPQEAIYADDRGVKIVDEEKCIGCGACVQACPWTMPTVNPETNKASKCILCGACAAGCPTSALTIVTWDEVTQAAQTRRKQ